ncbi:hypothetical protein JCM30760_19220 [Thiomicrorhabdus hydrogeniphila]
MFSEHYLNRFVNVSNLKTVILELNLSVTIYSIVTIFIFLANLYLKIQALFSNLYLGVNL